MRSGYRDRISCTICCSSLLLTISEAYRLRAFRKSWYCSRFRNLPDQIAAFRSQESQAVASLMCGVIGSLALACSITALNLLLSLDIHGGLCHLCRQR